MALIIAAVVKFETPTGDYWVLRCHGKIVYIGKLNRHSVQIKRVKAYEYVYIVGRAKNKPGTNPQWLYIGRLLEKKNDGKLIRVLVSEDVVERLFSERTREGRAKKGAEGLKNEVKDQVVPVGKNGMVRTKKLNMEKSE